MTYIADPLYELSKATDVPLCYAPPLLPMFRQHLLDGVGQEWVGLLGQPHQTPAEPVLAGLTAGSQGLLFLGPGRFMTLLAPQVIADLDMRDCTAALLLDRLYNSTASARQVHVDNRKYPDELQLEDPMNTALLLMMRGVKSAAVTTCTGTSYTHMQLATALMKLLTNSSSSRSLSAAVWAAQRDIGLAGFELAALRSGAGVVVYGAVDGVVAVCGDGAGRRAGRGTAAASGGAADK
eukprot:gene8286-8473_t